MTRGKGFFVGVVRIDILIDNRYDLFYERLNFLIGYAVGHSREGLRIEVSLSYRRNKHSSTIGI